jgi:excisionase family DNA binding protein
MHRLDYAGSRQIGKWRKNGSHMLNYAELMTSAEAAAYLRIGERTLYELVRRQRIPCSRAAGKLLFPRHLVDLWLEAQIEVAGTPPRLAPPVLGGSHDPLLEWALRESGCGLALLAGGSVDGLRRLAVREVMVAGLHILEPGGEGYNVAAVRALAGLSDVVLIEWAWRRQGLVLASGNPLRIGGIADLLRPDIRVARRQEEAGAQILLRHLLAGAGGNVEQLGPGPVATNETDLAGLILDGKADAGLAVESVARRFRLDFVPLHRERFDLALRRRDYFAQPIQTLLEFARSPAFAARAVELGGYDVARLGAVAYNA